MADSNKETDKLVQQLDDLLGKAKANISSVNNQEELEQERVNFIGRKSELTNILRGIKDLSVEGKKVIGQKANTTKLKIEELIEKKQQDLLKDKLKNIETKEKIDITIPAKKSHIGRIHPITAMRMYAEDIFRSMGFEVEYPYEIDTDYNNFQAVNIPEGHPARDSWDTFWTEDKHIAITHTSSMQNRVLKSKQPPIRVIVPGRCFRNEATDARHEHTFNQIEGIYVDKGITLGDMLGTLKAFFTEFFGTEVEVKFTPDFFPFVEPGGMMSLTCFLCDGKGCDVCKKTGWLEVLGCGMIHPNVLKMGGIDSDVYSGFAWGFGLERLIMLKYGVEDIRHFHSGNLEFIRQF